ncbi:MULTISPECIES: aminotransferase class I/II-fold pyridoxal phosphate-dependent enzyme [unclassified Polaromonas]|uniref:aminotransferase class I/II-fold pyridoxal phosphate-dependent enzyme n=1 Tax=unclassified Polaromonas TaxID=2638319 RepID=UPI000F081BC7|nr:MULTISPECIES: aminotransferase class I/II-fold pyridoxal phosphate-dependent enzyme [unclassified Polaromonas]AYQ29898.1 aminotransferase class I/II-fold pyridoxal phosphate-dependent enzyme [Polaromonas sp. SP1]QGJ18989.1 aminotransferase class I/II-fold pyridoxal phosphate-dependent enzyme [Polaromonas sp. Pch-P]
MSAGLARHARIHGGPDGLGVPLHDFSTNSNACGPCPAAQAAVSRADATRYPDAGYTALRAQLAAFHQVDEARVLLAGSASEFIFRITALAVQGGARSAWLPPMSYGDYAQAAAAHRLAVAGQPADAQLLWACEPSSPAGAAQAGLQALAAEQKAHTFVVLDRAYEPLRLGSAPTLSPQQLQTTWQIWTPNKALGLTGVRAAYAIAPVGRVDAAQALEQLCPSWPVGAHGVAMLQAWTGREAQDWLAASLETLREWKARQIGVCESLGWKCLPGEANFFCAQPALPEGLDLQQALAALRASGIKLRDTTSFGLPGHVRLGVLPPGAQDDLHNAWQQLIKASQ